MGRQKCLDSFCKGLLQRHKSSGGVFMRFLPPTKCIWFKWAPNSLPSCRGIFFILKVNSTHSWNSKQKVNIGEKKRKSFLEFDLYLLQWQKVIFLKPKGASLFSFRLQACYDLRRHHALKHAEVLSIRVESCCSRQLVSFHRIAVPLKTQRKEQDGWNHDQNLTRCFIAILTPSQQINLNGPINFKAPKTTDVYYI